MLRRPGDLPPGHCESEAAGAGADDDHGTRGRTEELEEYPGDCSQYYQVIITQYLLFSGLVTGELLCSAVLVN